MTPDNLNPRPPPNGPQRTVEAIPGAADDGGQHRFGRSLTGPEARHSVHRVEPPTKIDERFPAWKSRKGFRSFPSELSETAMSYSLREAATAIGMQKPGLLKAIQSGKVSAEKDANGQWRIEPAELHRVYPPVHPPVSNGNGSDAVS